MVCTKRGRSARTDFEVLARHGTSFWPEAKSCCALSLVFLVLRLKEKSCWVPFMVGEEGCKARLTSQGLGSYAHVQPKHIDLKASVGSLWQPFLAKKAYNCEHLFQPRR